MRKYICVWIVFVFVLSCFSGCQGSGGATTTENTQTAQQTTAGSAEEPLKLPLAEPITIKYVTCEHPTQGRYPFEDGNVVHKWLEEQTNIKLDVEQIPYGGIKEKINLLISTNDIPDLMINSGTSIDRQASEDLGLKGMFVNILDYEELIPNYMKVIESSKNLQSYIHDNKLFAFWG